jgi:hypothetical protein
MTGARSLLVSFIGSGILTFSGCCGKDLQPSLADAKPFCTVVTFPAPWDYGNDPGGSISAPSYEFRQAKGEESVLIVQPEPKAGGGLSRNRFAFNLDNPKRVRLAAGDEWETGTALPLQRNSIMKSDAEWERPLLTLKGRQYQRREGMWAAPRDAALLSSTGKWLLLQSMSGKTIPHALYGSEPAFGEVMAQVYDTATGRKRFEIRTRFCNISGSYATYRNGWLTERHLMFDLDYERRSIIICDAEKKP